MKARKYVACIGVILMFTFQYCSRQTDSFTVQSYKDYYPLVVGKYIVYRLDSTVFVDFDTKKEIHSYQVKDLVEEEITDNLDRKSYRIRRMIRDLEGTDQWRDIATMMVTPLPGSLETVEENQRYIKLKDPVKDYFYWDGNSYIQAVDDLSYLQFWEYLYQNVGEPYLFNDQHFDNTITVTHVDEAVGDPESMPNNFASKDYSIEVYAKNIGLIYKDFVTWVYQATPVTNNCRAVSATDALPCPVNINCDSLAVTINGYVRCDTVRVANAYTGYGIKLSLQEHN